MAILIFILGSAFLLVAFLVNLRANDVFERAMWTIQQKKLGIPYLGGSPFDSSMGRGGIASSYLSSQKGALSHQEVEDLKEYLFLRRIYLGLRVLFFATIALFFVDAYVS